MKANELRIGNWYKWYAGGKYYEYQVEAIDLIQNYENFEPIPLTEEWLMKFGFKKLTPKGSILELGEFHVQNFSPLGFYECRNHINLKSVHQLQNVHFALTGEELTIK